MTNDLRLSGRQREVLSLLAMGFTAEEIGRELSISARTARAHTDVLRQKLGTARCRQLPEAYRRATGLDPLRAVERET